MLLIVRNCLAVSAANDNLFFRPGAMAPGGQCDGCRADGSAGLVFDKACAWCYAHRLHM